MANLSQLRRQRMLAFLEKMREQHKDDDEVLVAINEVENEINEKKYGLVWEEHSEEVEERMVDEVPIFVEDKDKEITMTDNGYNFLLEGDNLHSLHLLEKTHKEKIDVIYIDPPYNTGNEDFIYDDNYVDKEDAFRHSKWLSFMKSRLTVAKKLLSVDGVVFISIDDNEMANLKLVCDSVFGADSFIGCLPRVTKKSGKQHSNNIANNHDYVLVYSNTESPDTFCGIQVKDDSYPFKDEFYEERGGYQLNQTLDYSSLFYNEAMDYEIDIEGEKFYAGGDKTKWENRHNGDHKNTDWVWRWGKQKLAFGLENGFVVIKSSRNGKRIYTKTYAKASIGKNGNDYFIDYVDRENNLSSLSLTENSFSNDNAKKELQKVMPSGSFDFPKPSLLIRQLLEIIRNKDVEVLDFFAGSGTTGQAVLELNKDDGGNRHFILCTNNENNICDDVTYPRIKTIITGERKDGKKYSDGVPANLKYYHTDFIPKKNDNLANDLIAHIDEMIQLEYGVKIDKEKYISILTDEDADELEKNWTNYPNIRAIYISRHVLLTGKQKELFGTHDCFTIPDYYFREELREAGEA